MLNPTLGPSQLVIDGEVYDLADMGDGQRRWMTTEVASQPGDGSSPKPFPIELHGGFGCSFRHLSGRGQGNDPTHHAYGENVDARFESLWFPAPRLNYIDMTEAAQRRRGFRIGWFYNSRFGGGYRANTDDLLLPHVGEADGFEGSTAFIFSGGYATYAYGSVPFISSWPGLVENPSSFASWVNPERVTEDDDSFASTNLTGDPSGLLVARQFAPLIPRKAVIGGIEVSVRRRKGAAVHDIEDLAVRLVYDGAVIGANRAEAGQWDHTAEVVTYGGPTDTWGLTEEELTPEEANDPSFGIGIAVQGTGSALVDYIKVRINWVYTYKVGTLGGGAPVDQPQHITEYGGYLYVHCGANTYTIDPETPEVVEGHLHGTSARARSSDVFNERLFVGLGDTVDAEVATAPFLPGSPTSWQNADGVQRSVVRTGSRGRLFTSNRNRVWNVLPGFDPAEIANHFPSSGEVLTDSDDPVRGLEEFAAALVAGTAKTLRTADPNRGFQGVSLLPESRLSASDYDGRSILRLGNVLLHATTRGIYMVTTQTAPFPAGPELLHANETPYVGGQPGKPDISGDWFAFPYYFPDSGDSVIFFGRLRREGERGTGPIAWHDTLFLEGRECRVVYFWGGSRDVKPRWFFGAGTPENREQVGWIDAGRGAGPDIFDTDAQPALTGFIRTPRDDYGTPGVRKEVERIEFPRIRNADADNYLTVAVSADGGPFVEMTPIQIEATGYQKSFSPEGEIPTGRDLSLEFRFTQAEEATEFLIVQGAPFVYISEIPDQVTAVSTYLDVKSNRIEDAERIADRLRALAATGRIKITYTPGDLDVWVRIREVNVTEIEFRSGDKTNRRLAVELAWREIEVAA